MALHKNFPKSPHEILDPKIRWFPADEALREKGYEKLLPPLVHTLRQEIKKWRDNNYEGVSDTSRALLQWWFQTEHPTETADGTVNFQYYFSQREAIETVIFFSKFKRTREYLCGSFDNAPVFSKNIEVGYMDYEELSKHIGDRHYYKECDELTLIIKGGMEEKIENDTLKLKEGDFFFVSPGTTTELISVEEGTSLIVVKGPSIPTDKFKDE